MQRKCVTPLRDAVKRRKEEKEECSAGWEKLVWVENFLVGSTTAGGKTAEREQVGKNRRRSAPEVLGTSYASLLPETGGDLVQRECFLGTFFGKIEEKSTPRKIAADLPAEQTTASPTTTTTFDCVSSSSSSEGVHPPAPVSLLRNPLF